MNKVLIFAALVSCLPFVSCVEPEIVPAPSPNLSLSENFIGTLNGSQIEWTKNVNGYRIATENDFFVDTNGNGSGLRFYSGMASATNTQTVKIGIGLMPHDPSVSSGPSIANFKDFVMQFADPLTAPPYAANAAGGFEVQYRDASGELMKSQDSDPGTYTFSNIKYKEDEKGEYMTFVCDFSANVYSFRKDTSNVDTIYRMASIQNARLTGYFKRSN